jgi:hypothetical protein
MINATMYQSSSEEQGHKESVELESGLAKAIQSNQDAKNLARILQCIARELASIIGVTNFSM